MKPKTHDHFERMLANHSLPRLLEYYCGWSKWLDPPSSPPPTEEQTMDPGRCEPDGSMDGNFFERFPNEVLFWVASRLSSKDLGRLAQVDRRWNAIAQIPLLWENLCTDELGFRFLDRPDTTDWVGTFRNLQLSSFSTPCYQNPSATILGCVHYQRFCKIRAACCGRWFACRLCHDQASDHQMNRYRVREMYCMRCRTVQPCAPTCRNQSCASRRPLKYYCDECKLWEDNPSKDIYHCEHCGFCRMGNQGDFYHCPSCNMCISCASRDRHNCKPGQTLGQCPACHKLGPMWNGLAPICFLPCGDAVHLQCLERLRHENLPCPVCEKPITDPE